MCKPTIRTVALGADCPTESDQPLTVLAKHHVRPDKLKEFESWFHEITHLCEGFKGYIGTELIRPTCVESDEYISIFRYDNYTNLQVWMNSEERQSMIDRISEFSDETTVHVSYHSLEHWFVPSENKSGGGGGPPAKYKMWLVTFAVIYSQSLWVLRLTGKLSPRVHPDAIGAISVATVVTISQFIIFPIVTRLLAFWLYPGEKYTDKLRELVPSVLVKREEKEKESSIGETERSSSSVSIEEGTDSPV